jgi:hypothetical protein
MKRSVAILLLLLPVAVLAQEPADEVSIPCGLSRREFVGRTVDLFHRNHVQVTFVDAELGIVRGSLPIKIQLSRQEIVIHAASDGETIRVFAEQVTWYQGDLIRRSVDAGLMTPILEGLRACGSSPASERR